MRRVVNSLDNIQNKWPIHSGRVRVKILGEEKDLPADLRELVEALDPDKCIEGNDLADLCRQRSERRGNGCDVPRASEEIPEPSASSSTEEHRPAVQVNQFSWHIDAKTDKRFRDKRRKFRNSGKYSNSASFFPSQQAPLVSQEHLQAVVRKVARGEKFKDKKQQRFVIKSQQNNGHELMTSLAHSRQQAEGGNQRDSCYMHHRKLGTVEIALIYRYKTSMHSVKPSEGKKERKESQFKRTTRSSLRQSHDVIDDGIKVDGGRQNRPVARKYHTTPKHLCSHVKEYDDPLVNISKQFFVKLAFILMLIGNVIKSALSLNSLNLKRVIGLVTLACVSRETRGSADPLLPTPPCVFGWKISYAYILSHTNVCASWMYYFDKYIQHLDFEYETKRFL